jgi:thiol-disulfide isomerase/thioredoxin
MGKASREKRERREQAGAQTPQSAGRHASSGGGGGDSQRQLPVFWIVIGALVLAGIAALVLTAPDDRETAAESAASKVPTFADVTVEGDSLPTWSGSGSDLAEGKLVPSISAEKFDGFRTSITPDGTARVYVVVAHWCPHCQDEVPRIVDWAAENEVPDGVEVLALSTSASKDQPNYSPAAWLAREQWPFDALIDDELGTGAEALGVEGFPFLIFTDADGTVTKRFSGEMPIDEFEQELLALAPKSDAVPAAKPAA